MNNPVNTIDPDGREVESRDPTWIYDPDTGTYIQNENIYIHNSFSENGSDDDINIGGMIDQLRNTRMGRGTLQSMIKRNVKLFIGSTVALNGTDAKSLGKDHTGLPTGQIFKQIGELKFMVTHGWAFQGSSKGYAKETRAWVTMKNGNVSITSIYVLGLELERLVIDDGTLAKAEAASRRIGIPYSADAILNGALGIPANLPAFNTLASSSGMSIVDPTENLGTPGSFASELGRDLKINQQDGLTFSFMYEHGMH